MSNLFYATAIKKGVYFSSYVVTKFKSAVELPPTPTNKFTSSSRIARSKSDCSWLNESLTSASY